MKNKYTLIIVIITTFLVVVSFSFIFDGSDEDSTQECRRMRDQSLPFGFNSIFAGSGECAACHDNTATTMVDDQGNSVSVTDDWRSSMMGNAAKDPFWRAKVSHEGIVNPNHAEALESVCTRCHTPQGRFEAFANGAQNYPMSAIDGDSLSNDGVSCTVCHQIRSDSLNLYSGNLLFNDNYEIYGQYLNPFANPMLNNVGYEPVYSDHISSSKICGTCHTLLTNSVDLQGIPTGTQFVEQAIYHEWENSQYPQNGMSCQTCHMPSIDDIVTLSQMPPWLDGRTPFSQHHFVGANVQIQRLLKENIDSLGITAESVNFDSTINRTLDLLQNHSVNMSVEEQFRNNDSVFYIVELENLAGHKFPGGYPSRRAFIEFIVVNEIGDTIFHSGKMDENFYLIDEDSEYEMHYNIINSDDQVQIYELVMGDVNNDVTTVLERAVNPLKDNRLPPIGFTSGYYNYDTVQVVGNALTDDSFNLQNSLEGSGRDVVNFHIPLNNYTGELMVKTIFYYQTVSPKWLEEMFQNTSVPIDKFKDMYLNSDRNPVIVSTINTHSYALGIEDNIIKELKIFPNPAKDNLNIVYSGKGFIEGYKLISTSGALLVEKTGLSKSKIVIDTSNLSGVILAEIVLSNNRKVSRQVIIN